MKPNPIPMKYCNIITAIITSEELMMAPLFAPITPATIIAITTANNVGNNPLILHRIRELVIQKET